MQLDSFRTNLNSFCNLKALTLLVLLIFTQGCYIAAKITDTNSKMLGSNTAPLIINRPMATESSLQLNFTIRRNIPTGSEVTLDYAISSSTATPGLDYVTFAGSTTLSKDQEQKMISIQLIDDLTTEPTENIYLKIISVNGILYENLEFEGLILDNDFAPGLVQNSMIVSGVYDLTSTPILTWGSVAVNASGLDHVEVRVIDNNNQVLQNWTTLTSGSALSGLSLEKGLIYEVEIRAVDSAGNLGVSSVIGSWSAGSDSCSMDKISNSPFASGNGTKATPYIICTIDQFKNIGLNSMTLLAHYKLNSDLNFKGVTSFTSMGSYTNKFTGKINGQNFSILEININNDPNFYGLFTSSENATFENIKFNNIQVSNIANFGIISSEAKYSSFLKIEGSNIVLNGTDSIGGLVSWSEANFAENINLDLLINGQNFLGGIFAEDFESIIIKSSLNVTLNGSYGLGGLMGGNWGESGVSNLNLIVNINGDDHLGGIFGEDGSGMFVNKVKVSGSITGNVNIGGLFGEIVDLYAEVYSADISVNLSGNQYVGGVSGSNWDNLNIYDSLISGSITATGLNPKYIGGLIGYSSGGGVFRTLSMMNINGNGEIVGGVMGAQENGWRSPEIADSIAVGSINGSSASSEVSMLVGKTELGATPITTNNYYISNCNNSLGSCNSIYGTNEPLANNLYSPSHAVYSSWDFTNNWQNNVVSYPSLRSNTSGSLSFSSNPCPSNISVSGSLYCMPVFLNTHANTKIVFKKTENNTCNWLTITSRAGLQSHLKSSDLGICLISVVAINGFEESAPLEFMVTVVP